MSKAAILIISENLELTDHLSSPLEEGYSVEVAETGAQGVERLEAQVPDLIIIDVELPDAEGFEFCARLRERLGDQPTALLLCLKVGNAEGRARAYEHGADDCLIYPVEATELLAKVGGMIKHCQSLRQLAVANREAQSLAFRSMTESSHYGAVISFFRAAIACTTQDDLAAAFFEVMGQFGLSAALEMRGTQTLTLSASGEPCSTGPGIAMALDPYGTFGSERIFSDFRYEWKELLNQFDLETRVSYAHMTQDPDNNILLFPAGAFGGSFPDGFIGNPGYKEDQARIELSGRYRGITRHILRGGSGLFWGDMYEVTEQKNFNTDFTPKGSVVDVSDNPDEVWMPEVQRTNYYLFAQDEWQFVENWNLTTGIRYDHYSDFGGTLNPRFALVWATTDSVTTKLLYGRAFRPPSFNELYVINNPNTVGDPELKPQTIDTYELALSHQLTREFLYTLNAFYYHTDNLISSEPQPGLTKRRYANVGQQSAHGAEIEATYTPDHRLSVATYYAWQHAVDDRTGARAANVPQHQAYARVIWEMLPGWQFTPQLSWVGRQARAPQDTRPPLEDYITLDISLRKQNVLKKLDISVTAQNIFDVDVKDPSPVGNPTEIPGDFPLAGVMLLSEIQYRF